MELGAPVADNKNQHFELKCHFRLFTRDEEGKSIKLVELDRRAAIPNAPVRSQCSGDYFYGQDPRLESAVQIVEGAMPTPFVILARS